MRPEEASRLLNDPSFTEVQELARQQIRAQWENEPDPLKREEYWHQLNCIRLYHQVLQTILNAHTKVKK